MGKKPRKGMGNTIDHGDFILIRPISNYRMNGAVTIIKGKEPVIIDTGAPRDTSIQRIKTEMLKHNIFPKDIKYIIITHNHEDHAPNLRKLQDLCNNAKVICHKADHQYITNHSKLIDFYGKLFNFWRFNVSRIISRIALTPLIMFFFKTHKIFSKVHYITDISFSANEFDLRKCPSLKIDKNELILIPTPGHTQGHLCVLESNGNLFLGDFIPFTPWIDPTAEALEDMIQSIKNICSIPNGKIKYAVRSHGDYRRGNINRKNSIKLRDNGPWYDDTATWEVAKWEQEKARFQFFLSKINESLDLIPKFLRKRPMTVYDIFITLIPRLRNVKSTLMLYFSTPSITWVIAYCKKLERDGIIESFKKGRQLYWKLKANY